MLPKYNLCCLHHTGALHHNLPEVLLWPQTSQSISVRILSAKTDRKHLWGKITPPAFCFSLTKKLPKLIKSVNAIPTEMFAAFRCVYVTFLSLAAFACLLFMKLMRGLYHGEGTENSYLCTAFMPTLISRCICSAGCTRGCLLCSPLLFS